MQQKKTNRYVEYKCFEEAFMTSSTIHIFSSLFRFFFLDKINFSILNWFCSSIEPFEIYLYKYQRVRTPHNHKQRNKI